MRLEIIIDDDQPLFFPFTNKVTIGSDPACEIVIEHPEVSRRHASAFPEDERFFIVDQGSKNGTYLNDERLIPGKKTEFTSFFPVRLGKSILISLISDEEISERTSPGIEIPIPSTPKTSTRNQDATTLVSLKDLQAAKTETMAKKRAAVRKTQAGKEAPGKKKPAPKKKKKISSSQIMALLIVAAAGAYQYSLKEDAPTTDAPVSTGPLKTPESKKAPVEAEEKIIPTSADLLLKKLSSKGCESEAEKAICSRIPDLRHLSISDNSVDIIVEAAPTYEAAAAILKEFTDKSGAPPFDQESKEVALIMAADFFTKYLVSFPAKNYPDSVITVAFVFRKGEIETFLTIAAYKVKTLASLNVVLTPQQLYEIRTGGPGGIGFTSKFFSTLTRDNIKWEGPSGVAASASATSIDQPQTVPQTEAPTTETTPDSEYRPLDTIRPATEAIPDPSAKPVPKKTEKPVPQKSGNPSPMPILPSPNSP